jgi:hypothetical protein
LDIALNVLTHSSENIASIFHVKELTQNYYLDELGGVCNTQGGNQLHNLCFGVGHSDSGSLAKHTLRSILILEYRNKFALNLLILVISCHQEK